jgi:hypothetical protein
MVLGIFIGGMFLGFSLGFAVMALLAVSSLPSKPKRRQGLRVNFPIPTLPPKILNPCWGLAHRASEPGLTLGLERGGGPRLGTRTWQ